MSTIIEGGWPPDYHTLYERELCANKALRAENEALKQQVEQDKLDAVMELTENEILEIARVQSNSIAVNRNHDFILRFATALFSAAPKQGE